MSIAEFHSTQHHSETQDVSARWFTIAMITGAAFLTFAVLSYVVG